MAWQCQAMADVNQPTGHTTPNIFLRTFACVCTHVYACVCVCSFFFFFAVQVLEGEFACELPLPGFRVSHSFIIQWFGEYFPSRSGTTDVPSLQCRNTHLHSRPSVARQPAIVCVTDLNEQLINGCSQVLKMWNVNLLVNSGWDFCSGCLEGWV